MSESDGFLNTKEDFWKNQIKGWNQSLPDSPYELEVFSQPLSENPSVTTHLPGSIQIEVCIGCTCELMASLMLLFTVDLKL